MQFREGFRTMKCPVCSQEVGEYCAKCGILIADKFENTKKSDGFFVSQKPEVSVKNEPTGRLNKHILNEK